MHSYRDSRYECQIYNKRLLLDLHREDITVTFEYLCTERETDTLHPVWKVVQRGPEGHAFNTYITKWHLLK